MSMRYPDRHVITDATTDKTDLVLEPSNGGDLLVVTIETCESGKMEKQGFMFLDREGAQRAFALLGAFLHVFPEA